MIKSLMVAKVDSVLKDVHFMNEPGSIPLEFLVQLNKFFSYFLFCNFLINLKFVSVFVYDLVSS